MNIIDPFYDELFPFPLFSFYNVSSQDAFWRGVPAGQGIYHEVRINQHAATSGHMQEA